MDYVGMALIVEALAIWGVVHVALYNSPYNDDPGHF